MPQASSTRNREGVQMTDTEILDWLEHQQIAHFECRNTHVKPEQSKKALFTISSQHINGDSIRDCVRTAAVVSQLRAAQGKS